MSYQVLSSPLEITNEDGHIVLIYGREQHHHMVSVKMIFRENDRLTITYCPRDGGYNMIVNTDKLLMFCGRNGVSHTTFEDGEFVVIHESGEEVRFERCQANTWQLIQPPNTDHLVFHIHDGESYVMKFTADGEAIPCIFDHIVVDEEYKFISPKLYDEEFMREVFSL